MNQPKYDYQKHVENGLEWLIHSGIQCSEYSEASGGFFAWFDAETRKYSFVYSEITGYALNLLLSIRPKTFIPGIDNAIKSATDYLIKKAFDHKFGATKWKYIPNKGWVDDFWSFDNIIVANSLINKFRIDGDQEALQVSKVILETIMKKFSFGDGVYARYIPAENRFQNENIKWSTCFGPFHAKLSIPFLNMYDITQENKLLDFVHHQLNSIMKFQQSNGRFITDCVNSSTFLHPHLYALEGFLVAGLYLNDRSYLEVVRKGLDWISTLGLKNGGIACFYNNNECIPLDSPDINSQYMRCLCLFDFETAKKKIPKLKQRILSHQLENKDDKKSFGGFRIGDIWFYDQINLSMTPIKTHINTWATIFAINSLLYLNDAHKSLFNLC